MSRALIDSIIDDRITGAEPITGPDRLLQAHADVFRQFIADCQRDGVEDLTIETEPHYAQDATRVCARYRGFQIVSHLSGLDELMHGPLIPSLGTWGRRRMRSYSDIVNEAARIRREREENGPPTTATHAWIAMSALQQQQEHAARAAEEAERQRQIQGQSATFWGMDESAPIPSNIWWRSPEPVDPAIRRMDGQTAHDVLAREVERRRDAGQPDYQEIRVTRELASALVGEMQQTAFRAGIPPAPAAPLDQYRGVTFMGCPVIWDETPERAEFAWRQYAQQIQVSPEDAAEIERMRRESEARFRVQFSNALFATTPRNRPRRAEVVDEDDYEANYRATRRRMRRGHQAATVHEGMAKLETVVMELTARAA